MKGRPLRLVKKADSNGLGSPPPGAERAVLVIFTVCLVIIALAVLRVL